MADERRPDDGDDVVDIDKQYYVPFGGSTTVTGGASNASDNPAWWSSAGPEVYEDDGNSRHANYSEAETATSIASPGVIGDRRRSQACSCSRQGSEPATVDAVGDKTETATKANDEKYADATRPGKTTKTSRRPLYKALGPPVTGEQARNYARAVTHIGSAEKEAPAAAATAPFSTGKVCIPQAGARRNAGTIFNMQQNQD